MDGEYVQGSILGILQHNVSLDRLDDGQEEMLIKNVDDLSLIEALDARDSDEKGRLRAVSGEARPNFSKNLQNDFRLACPYFILHFQLNLQ